MQENSRNLSLEIRETKKELNNTLEKEEREENNTTLRKNDKINWKHLLQRKNRKFTYVKYKPTRPTTKTTEFEHGSQFHRNANNPGEKPTYVSILHEQSNTNIHRKLSKQNIAETNNNTSIAQKLLINRQNKHHHNKPRSIASATSNTDNENTQNMRQNLEQEIKWLKNEVASSKEHHVTPPQDVIPVWGQMLPSPPSKASPKKIIHDSKNNQTEIKNLQTTSI